VFFSEHSVYTLNNIHSSADRSQPTLLVSVDLSAAFDTIDHKILINRLSNSFGISGSVLGWLTSYLSNRSQLVRVGQAQSNLTQCTSGVPQGSVLGTVWVLFSIYTSPIAQIAQDYNISLQQYADDTLLYLGLSTSSLQTATSRLECCLSSLHACMVLL